MQAGKQLKRLKRRVKICGVETRQKNYVRRAPKLSRKSFNQFELKRAHSPDCYVDARFSSHRLNEF
jgi:hypothetical protein